MSIYLQELKFQARSIILWLGSIITALLLFMGIFPEFSREADLLKDALAAFPESLIASIGMDINTIFEASGFVSYIYGFIQLVLVIMATLYGFTLMNREKLARMSDFLYVKPLSRQRIFLEKLLASLTAFLIIHIAIVLMFYLMASLWGIESSNQAAINQMILSGLLLQILTFALTTLWGTLSQGIKNPVGSASAFSFGLFLILLVGRLMNNDVIKKLSPFGYVEPLEISAKGLSNTTSLSFCLLSLVLLTLSAIILDRQDLEA